MPHFRIPESKCGLRWQHFKGHTKREAKLRHERGQEATPQNDAMEAA